MINHEEHLNRVFHALADPTRRKILERIANSDVTVGELAEPFSISAPAISKHLKTLEIASLIKRVKEGKTHRFQLNSQPLQSAQNTINQLTAFWLQRLAKLETLLTENSTQHHESSTITQSFGDSQNFPL